MTNTGTVAHNMSPGGGATSRLPLTPSSEVETKKAASGSGMRLLRAWAATDLKQLYKLVENKWVVNKQ
jgi:hypothetical protein